MNRDALLIVLTENSWLHAGIAALLPEIVCQQVRFCAHRLPGDVRHVRHIFIAVDSLILFRGEWDIFNALKVMRPDATVVWLTREEIGRVFPAGCRGERIVYQRLSIVSLHLTLRRALLQAELRREDECVAETVMTLTEQRLLPLFLSGMTMPALSQLTGKAVKTLYAHKYGIQSKTGFRQPLFLQFVYERNRGMLGISGQSYTYRCNR